jgi:hypothetical protein
LYCARTTKELVVPKGADHVSARGECRHYHHSSVSTTELCVEYEENEKLPVEEAYGVGDPRAVVVHVKHQLFLN